MGKIKRILKKEKERKEKRKEEFLKKRLNIAREKLEKYKERKEKMKEGRERIRLINSIWSLREMIIVEETEGNYKGQEMSIQSLSEMTTDKLIERLEGMIEEAEKNI